GFVTQRGGVAGEHEEHGLEGVLGVLLMAQDTATNVQHHRPMPAHEDGKGTVVAASGENVQQLLIAFLVALLRSQFAAKAAKPGGQGGTTHECDSHFGTCCLLLIVPSRRPLRTWSANALRSA